SVSLATVCPGNDNVSLRRDLIERAAHVIGGLARAPQAVHKLSTSDAVIAPKCFLSEKQQNQRFLKGIGACSQRHDTPLDFDNSVQCEGAVGRGFWRRRSIVGLVLAFRL